MTIASGRFCGPVHSRRFLVGSYWMRLAVLLLSPSAHAQDIGSREWLDGARRAAANVTVPADTYFVVQYTYRANGDAEKLAAMAQAVEGKPEHPDRSAYLELARRLEKGPDITTDRVWYFGAKQWRISTDQPWETNRRVPWRDVAVNGSVAWRLIPDTITILDSAHPAPGHEAEFERESAATAWRYLTTQNILVGPGWEPTLVERDGTQWRAAFQNRDRSRECTYLGRFEQDGRLFVYEATITRSSDDPKWLGTTTHFEPDTTGLLPVTIDGLVPAVALQRHSPTGALAPEEWRILEVGTASERGGPDVLRQPDPSLDDPIRDVTTVTGLIDRTSGQQYVVEEGLIDRGRPMSYGPAAGSSLFERWGTGAAVALMAIVIGGLVVLRSKISR